MPATPPIVGPGTVPPGLLARAHGAAAWLAARGITEGSRIAVDSPEVLPWFLGGDLLGAAVLVVEPGWSEGERQAVLADAAPDLVVTGAPEGTTSDVTPTGTGRTPFYLATTSGSSGRPKVLIRTRDSWLKSFAALGTLPGPVLIPGPLSSSLFLFGALHALWCGQPVRLLPRWEPEAAARAAAGAATVHLVPAMLAGLLSVLNRRPDRECALKTVVCGGAHLDPVLRERLAEVLPGTGLLAYYGSAEHSLIALDRGDGRLRPVPEVRLDIRDGILWVDSPLSCRGRLVGGALSPAERWSTVEDRAELDAGGGLVLHGRATAMLSSGGALVAVEEVERVLRGVPGVVDVVVSGTPHGRLGSLVTAVVELGETPVSLSALRAAARKNLAPGKRPRRWLAMRELPRTASGKPARAAIGEMLRNGTLTAEPLT